MIKYKKLISAMVAVCVTLTALAVFVFPAYAIGGYTNKATSVRLAPYSTATTEDNLNLNHYISILERDYDYIYIEYTKSGITKRGYIPRGDTNATGYGWCSHSIFESGYYCGSPEPASTAAQRRVLYTPGGTEFDSIGTDEGISTNKPLLVLREQGDYYFVQYVANPTNTGSEHILWRRGWVDKCIISLSYKTSHTALNNQTFYLRSVATSNTSLAESNRNLYLTLKNYEAGNVDGGETHLWNFHGGYNQEWYISPSYSYIPGTSTIASSYVTLRTNQGNEGRVLRVKQKTAIKGNNIDIYTATNSNTSKDQQFYLQYAGIPNTYYIYARCGANYMMVGVHPNGLYSNGPVYLNYPTYTVYNQWVLEPAAVLSYDYSYLYSNLNSPYAISNGVSIPFNTSSVSTSHSVKGVNTLITPYTNSALSEWNKTNSLVSVYSNSNAPNTIFWCNTGGYSVTYDPATGTPQEHYVFGQTHAYTSNGSFVYDVYMYYDAFDHYYPGVTNNQLMVAWKSTLTHEIGHCLNLNDNNSSLLIDAIMNHNRNRMMVLKPLNTEFAGAKKYYCN